MQIRNTCSRFCRGTLFTSTKLQSRSFIPTRYKMSGADDSKAVSDVPEPSAAARKSSEAVTQYLKDHSIAFFRSTHLMAYTSQQQAAAAHVSGLEFAKTVLVKLLGLPADKGNEVVMCVLRAPDRIKLHTLGKALGAASAELCTNEEVMAMNEHGMEPGALPPLPAMFGEKMQMFMDTELAKDQLIHFNAGSHHEVITCYNNDFIELTKPTKLDFAEPIDIHMRDLVKMLSKFKMGMPHGIIRHKPTYTASETAKAAAVPGLAMIKTVVVKLDGRMALCACCATDIIDLRRLAQLAKVAVAELATEEELKKHFPSVEVGAIPPFGELFKMPLYLDEAVGSWPVRGDGDVIFNAGTHTELMIMRYSDFVMVNRKWNEPVIGKFAVLDDGSKHKWTSTHIKRYLEGKDIPYTTLMHSVAFTASEIAHAAGVSGNFLAKTVMVSVDGKLAMAVLRAADFIDLAKLSALVGGKKVELAKEDSFADLFDHVEPGAVPPFGHLYLLSTFVDTKLTANEKVYMNAGTHKELICLSYADFQNLVKPVVGDFSRGPESHVAIEPAD